MTRISAFSAFSTDLRRIQESLTDAARIGSQEIKRGVGLAKRQLERVQQIQRRKDLFAQLGRALYEAHLDGLPPEIDTFVRNTEFIEMISEIQELEAQLDSQPGSKNESDLKNESL